VSWFIHVVRMTGSYLAGSRLRDTIKSYVHWQQCVSQVRRNRERLSCERQLFEPHLYLLGLVSENTFVNMELNLSWTQLFGKGDDYNRS